ncbi:MAG: flagellar biosynthetic protein FliR [Defluviitaleaceae bacterium]|nr:flagellar biosynthetic protein FliR [Defluviitaleaceae bacterium]
MGTAGFDILVQFYSQIDVLLLVFVRVMAFFLVIPIISSQNLWMLGRLFLAFVISIALFLSGRVTTVYYMDSVLGYIYLILVEFLVGMFIGYVAFAVFNLIFFAGQLIDFQIGLAMVNVLDPMTQIQVPIVGNLYYFSLMAMLVVTGGLHVLFGTFFYSYEIVPIGTGVVVGNAGLAYYVVHLMVESTILGVRIAMPLVGTMMVINAALGIMVKTVPQMNVFVVGLPMKLLVGLFLLLAVMTPSLESIFRHVFHMAEYAMAEVIYGLRPQ